MSSAEYVCPFLLMRRRCLTEMCVPAERKHRFPCSGAPGVAPAHSSPAPAAASRALCSEWSGGVRSWCPVRTGSFSFIYWPWSFTHFWKAVSLCPLCMLHTGWWTVLVVFCVEVPGWIDSLRLFSPALWVTCLLSSSVFWGQQFFYLNRA